MMNTSKFKREFIVPVVQKNNNEKPSRTTCFDIVT